MYLRRLLLIMLFNRANFQVLYCNTLLIIHVYSTKTTLSYPKEKRHYNENLNIVIAYWEFFKFN